MPTSSARCTIAYLQVDGVAYCGWLGYEWPKYQWLGCVVRDQDSSTTGGVLYCQPLGPTPPVAGGRPGQEELIHKWVWQLCGSTIRAKECRITSLAAAFFVAMPDDVHARTDGLF